MHVLFSFISNVNPVFFYIFTNHFHFKNNLHYYIFLNMIKWFSIFLHSSIIYYSQEIFWNRYFSFFTVLSIKHFSCPPMLPPPIILWERGGGCRCVTFDAKPGTVICLAWQLFYGEQCGTAKKRPRNCHLPTNFFVCYFSLN